MSDAPNETGVDADAKEASHYNRILASHIQSVFTQPCKIYVTEDIENLALRRLDHLSGIDAFQEIDGQMRGMALRIQYSANYSTYTIRYARASGTATEFQKRVKAMHSREGFLLPHFTSQIYLDKRTKRILGGAICETADLYDYVLQNLEFLREKQCRACPEGNKFLWVRFGQLEQAGVGLLYIPEQRLAA